MLLKSLVKMIFILILIAGLFFVVKYADDIRTLVSRGYNKKVAGAKTSIEDEMKKDVFTYADDLKQGIMEIKISDIVQLVSRVQRVNRDVESAKSYIVGEINERLKN